MFCREQVAQLRDKVPAIRALGAELVVVGNGKPHHAADFASQQALDFPLLVDPELKAYAAAGLRRGITSTFSPRSLLRGVSALREGFRQGQTQGDPWQQGGAFVLTPAGQVLYQQISKEAGDHADPEAVLEALRRAT